MSENGNSPTGLGATARRIVIRLALTACPPEIRDGDLAQRVLDEFEAFFPVLPRAVRWSVSAGLGAFNQGARLYPPAHGRRFASLGDDRAEAYLRAVLSRGGIGPVLQRIKGIVVLCYYELPEVKAGLGYRPDAYIAAVSQRRLTSYGAQIRAGEIALLADDRGSMPHATDRRDRP